MSSRLSPRNAKSNSLRQIDRQAVLVPFDLLRSIQRGGTAVTLLCLALLLAVLSRVLLISQHEVNWDEFLFLSRVYQYLRGDLSGVMQSGYVHLFTWLSWLPGDDMDRIGVARSIMLLLQVITGGTLYRICRVFFSRPAALFGVLSYFSFSYVIVHGTSFRADPIATFLLVSCLYLLLVTPASRFRMVLAGIFLGVAGIVTIKSVFYLPTIIVIMLVKLAETPDKRWLFLRYCTLTMSSVIAFSACYLLHKYSIDGNSLAASAVKVVQSYQKVTGDSTLFPRRYYLQRTFVTDLLYWVVLVSGFVLTILDLGGGSTPNRVHAAIMLALAIPMATFAFYRNSFPYYYVFALAPSCLLVARMWSALPWKKRRPLARLTGLLMVGLYMISLYQNGIVRPLTYDSFEQKALLQAVHAMFPEPVPYIDRNSMVVSYPKSGFFMSTWGMEEYRAIGREMIAEAIYREQPKFVLANTSFLDIENLSFERDRGLLDADIEALKANYIPHWGLVYVAGKSFSFDAPDTTVAFDMLIAGIYTIESRYPVLLDALLLAPYSTVRLEQGEHHISITKGNGKVSLRWGEKLQRPWDEMSSRPIYSGF